MTQQRALLIAEKPSVMRDIQKVYGKMSHPMAIDFAAFVGHVVELKSPEEYQSNWGKPWSENVLPMIPDKFEFKVKDNTKVIYSDLVKKIKKGNYDLLINANDAGREGSQIFYAFYKTANCNLPVKRYWASDTTEATIHAALLNLIDETEPSLERLKNSAMFRAVFDWLVGMNLSRAISIKSKSIIPIGRVMTPTLGLIVKREKDIQQFVIEDYFQVKGKFDGYESIWFGQAGESKLKTLDEAKSIIGQLDGESTIDSSIVELKTVPAPTLHSLLELQKEANKFYGYSAQETLDTAQALYEKHKLITYPRTESRYLPVNLANEITKHIQPIVEINELDAYADGLLQNQTRIDIVMKNNKYVDDKKVTDHHAIILTPTKPSLSNLNDKELNLYLLVARRFLSIFLDSYQFEKTTIVTKSGEHYFKTTGNVVLNKGYTVLYESLVTKKQTDHSLPNVSDGQSIDLKQAEILKKQTSPPERYNEQTLLQAMSNPGQFVSDAQL